MTDDSSTLLERLRLAHRKDVDLGLRPPYLSLLAALGNPQDKLGCLVHVAGTNGKGSVCAFLRAMVEASGHTANVFTSPHLVRFHERIRIKGKLIEEEELATLLAEIESKAETGSISLFEAGTAAAMTAFSRHPADVTILEVGLGGRLDATNVIDKPYASVITRLSFDHRDYLGDTMDSIAREKAGIMRRRTPCYTAPQPSPEALLSLRREAEIFDAPLYVGGEDWRIEAVDDAHFRFLGPDRKIENLPRPKLLGTHQLWNAGLALAASEALPFALDDAALREAMQNVYWPARLQRLEKGKLADRLPEGSELWIDGGHNDSAGEVLAAQLNKWAALDGKPLFLLFGMLSTKRPEEFLEHLAPYAEALRAVQIAGETPGYDPEELARRAASTGIRNAAAKASVQASLEEFAGLSLKPFRVLVCGSLYLAGRVLAENGTF